jgi:hypothetical protein
MKLFGQHIPERGGPASLGIYFQEGLQQRTLDVQQQALYSNIKMITMILLFNSGTLSLTPSTPQL